MHTCFNCGTKFEGNFCPECGTKWQANACPNCGAQLHEDAKFCPECGYSLQAAAPAEVTAAPENAPSVRSDSALRKIYGFLRYVPAAVFALYAVLLFAFFAAPAVSGMGGGISGYSIISEEESLAGTMIALIIFTALSLPLGAMLVLSHFLPALKYKTVKLGKREVSLTIILTDISYVFFFVLFLLGCILAGQVNALDGGIGMLKAGACPVLVIVFALVLTMCSAGSLAVRYLLTKKNPAWKAAEAEKEAAEKQKRADRKAALKAPAMPEAAAKPAKPVCKTVEPTPKLEARLQKIVRQKRVICWLIAILSPLTAFSIIGAICGGVKRVSWKPEKIRKNAGITIAAVWSFFCFAAILGVGCWLLIEGLMSDNNLPLTEVLYPVGICYGVMIFPLATFICALVVKRRANKLKVEIYGTKKPKKTKEYLQSVQEYKAAKKNYRAYKQQCAVYTLDSFLYQHGISYENRRVSHWAWIHRAAILSVSAVLIIAIVLVSVLVPVLNDTFKLSKIEKLNIGDSRERVVSVLGKPLGYDPTEEYVSRFEYFGGSYGNKKKKLAELEEKLLAAENFSEIAKLEEQSAKLSAEMETMTYKYVRVTFSENQVASVSFDTKRCDTESKEKETKSVKLSVSEFHKVSSDSETVPFKDVTAQVYYTDGSYVLMRLPEYTFDSVDFTDSGTYEISWNTIFGNQTYTVTVL